MTTKDSNLKIALFCGGSGTRMWPMSRQNLPKQFQPLIENESTFEMMIKRLAPEFSLQSIFPVTIRDNVQWVVKLAPSIPLENIIIEPETRDTAAAIGLAAAVLDKKFDNPNVLAMWSDHVVRNEKEFIKAIKLADKTATDLDKFIEIGVRPAFASTALGYLKVGKMIKNIDGLGVFEFVAQIEKPNLQNAKKFAESWEYLWHIGYAVWSAKKMLAQYEKNFKAGWKALIKIRDAWGTPVQEEVLRKEYEKIPKISVDYAINAHLTSDQQVVISADLGWRDVGTWNELKEEMAKQAEDNVIQGEVVSLDVKDSLIYSNKKEKLIAAIGVRGLIVVDTDDALLVCSKEKSQDVKKVIEKLKDEEKKGYL